VIAASPVKGKYDTPLDAESAYEVLQGKAKATATAPAPAEAPQQGGGMFGWLGDLFGTSRPRGQRLSTGQTIAREVTRTMVNRVAGQIAADLGKSVGGRTGGSIGRAIVRGTLGGMLRR
jgi:hypothetical protein